MISRNLRRYYFRIFLVIVFAVLARFLFVSSVRVSSDSMYPNLLPGDMVLTFSMNYKLDFPKLGIQWFSEDIRRGDLALFAYAKQPRIHYIKRIVALPGDVVQIKDGDLIINDRTCKKEPTPSADNPESWVVYKETCLEASNWLISDNKDNKSAQFPLLIVPAGEVLLLSDNRSFGLVKETPDDSSPHYWDTVPISRLEGRAVLVFWSVSHSSDVHWSQRWRVRWERLFTRL